MPRSGLSLPVPLLLCCGEAAAAGAMVSSTQDAASALMASMRAANTAIAPSEKPLDAEASEAEAVAASGKASGMGSLLNQEREDLVAEEKQLLQDILALLKEASCPLLLPHLCPFHPPPAACLAIKISNSS